MRPTAPDQLLPPRMMLLSPRRQHSGTELAIQKNPSDAIYFVAAEGVLISVSSSTNAISVVTVEAALNAGGLTNPVVTIALEQALTLGDNYIQSKTGGTNVSAQVVAFKQVCGDIGNGIQEGLTLTAKATLSRKK